ncbi:hypothetical protein UA75_25955 [Actinoalloteichus sp. GBA129-24]|uniref:Uncharacterized protein n=1 Tax=Actinoalloteichus fjordicus TaxID=1612552 RepID=A0AAC9LFW5_9PSEU|nr:hypothetical protein UA74_25370 [Actinoalloteichus fjordicus]APU23164.1 hypothetical protein UA75_25955 [Actinoalloteichus sp. GBA129-24]
MVDDEVVEGVMEAIEDDYLDLTVIMYLARDQTADDHELLRVAAVIAEERVRDGKIVPGDLAKNGFVPWKVSSAESAGRILAEADAWADAGKEVYFGTIAWFDLPERLDGNDE